MRLRTEYKSLLFCMELAWSKSNGNSSSKSPKADSVTHEY